jgi:hypothetical protein
MYDFEHPQALVEIDWAVGLDVAGSCGGPHFVAVEFFIAIGWSFRSSRQPWSMDPRCSWCAKLLRWIDLMRQARVAT